MMNPEEIMAKIDALRAGLDELTAAVSGEGAPAETPVEEATEGMGTESPAAPAPASAVMKRPKNDLMKGLKL